jgi:hypothetical protein
MEKKFTEFLNRDEALRTEIVDAICALGPKEKEFCFCHDLVSLGERSHVLVNHLHSWGITATDNRRYVYHELRTGCLLHILKSLEDHPRV